MYSNAGKQILHSDSVTGVVTHIADAKDNEAAHFLTVQANQVRFIDNAKRTLSPSWHGDKVALAQLKGRINGAIDAINKLDALKKTLFYGRDNNLITDGQGDCSGLADAMVMPVGANAANVFHAILGKVTEAGELLEALKACYNGDTFDRINAIEEVGDGFWYDAILLDEMQSDFGDAQGRVIAKLRARFPDKFNSVNANERDLAAERAILEDSMAPMRDEGDLLVDTEYFSYPTSEIEKVLDLCDRGIEAHGGEFYDPIRTILAPVGTVQGVTLEPSKPASGPEAVLAVEAKANAAFGVVKAHKADTVDAGAAMSPTPEMARGIGERTQDMPGEILARQPIRKSDVQK